MGESRSRRADKVGSTPRRHTSARRGAGGASKSARREFTIKSDFVEARDVQKRILDDVEEAGFNSQSQFAIKLALEEALINAIKHGNKLDPTKSVKIESIVSSAQAEIILEDQGAGFVRQAVPDPTLDENLEKCSGRGILLIEAYMTFADWTLGGRKLRMIKTNES